MRGRTAAGQEGFALILAILSLMLLTFLGLALATSTSTELQIATNYRWEQQAYYNAEAGIEAGRTILKQLDWQQVIWTRRNTSWNSGTGLPPSVPLLNTVPNYVTYAGPSGVTVRNFEASNCDHLGGGAGLGVVLNDGTTVFQYMTTLRGEQINGAVTLWVRRVIKLDGAGGASDSADAGDDMLVLTSEGVAPYTFAQHAGYSNSGSYKANVASKMLEYVLSRAASDPAGGCGGRSGQVGNSQEGSGFSGCSALAGNGSELAGALGSGITGTTTK